MMPQLGADANNAEDYDNMQQPNQRYEKLAMRQIQTGRNLMFQSRSEFYAPVRQHKRRKKYENYTYAGGMPPGQI